MLSQAQRTTILELNAQQVSKREIARVLGISRVAVRKVLRSNSTALPELHRAEKAEPHRQQILELFDQCKGNLVRVHEDLVAAGAEMSYPALTAFCRRHGIGYAPPVPREHSSLQTTPLLRCQRDIEQVRQLPPATDMRRLFFHRVDRLVRRDSTFLLKNRFFEAPSHLAGKRIEVRFDPLDLTQLEIYSEG